MADPKALPCSRFEGPPLKTYAVDIDNDGRLDRITVPPPGSSIMEVFDCDAVTMKIKCDVYMGACDSRDEYRANLTWLCQHGIFERPAIAACLPSELDGDKFAFAEGARVFLNATFRNLNGEAFKLHDTVRLISDDGMDADSYGNLSPAKYPYWDTGYPWKINSFDLKGFTSDPLRKNLQDMTKYPDATHKYAVITAYIMSTATVHYEKRAPDPMISLMICICCSSIIAESRYKEVPIELLSNKNIPQVPAEQAARAAGSCGGNSSESSIFESATRPNGMRSFIEFGRGF